MNNISHYVLWGADNDCYWIPDLKNHRYCCPLCGCKMSRSVENNDFRLKKSYDLSITYDGFLIGSDKFLSVIGLIQSVEIECSCIGRDGYQKNDHYKLEFLKSVEIDLAKAVPEFGSICDHCQQLTHVAGVKDYYLCGTPLESGIFRTNIEFGSGFERSPVIVVDVDSAAIIKKAGLKGVSLDPVIIQS